jgi:hypothetical protein
MAREGQAKGRAWAQIAGKFACASITRVIWRYQPIQLRTRVLVQSHILRSFKVFLDVKACADDLHHLLQRGTRWPKNEVIRFLEGIGEATTNEQAVPSIIAPFGAVSGRTPEACEPGAFGPLTHREALPILLMRAGRASTSPTSTRLRPPSGVRIPTGSSQDPAST